LRLLKHLQRQTAWKANQHRGVSRERRFKAEENLSRNCCGEFHSLLSIFVFFFSPLLFRHPKNHLMEGRMCSRERRILEFSPFFPHLSPSENVFLGSVARKYV
jgi:hypothetical protein